MRKRLIGTATILLAVSMGAPAGATGSAEKLTGDATFHRTQDEAPSRIVFDAHAAAAGRPAKGTAEFEYADGSHRYVLAIDQVLIKGERGCFEGTVTEAQGTLTEPGRRRIVLVIDGGTDSVDAVRQNDVGNTGFTCAGYIDTALVTWPIIEGNIKVHAARTAP